mmetsp:Transcript_6245/g.18925  ORF Transcript_6245/g.18925 Transcript_6245/m.18925 type:complete len:241 (+) Transcript_6245:306-1028(+)
MEDIGRVDFSGAEGVEAMLEVDEVGPKVGLGGVGEVSLDAFEVSFDVVEEVDGARRPGASDEDVEGGGLALRGRSAADVLLEVVRVDALDEIRSNRPRELELGGELLGEPGRIVGAGGQDGGLGVALPHDRAQLGGDRLDDRRRHYEPVRVAVGVLLAAVPIVGPPLSRQGARDVGLDQRMNARAHARDLDDLAPVRDQERPVQVKDPQRGGPSRARHHARPALLLFVRRRDHRIGANEE